MGLVNWRAAGFCNQALVPNLEGRSKALADTFKSQDVANTLWAYATMGQEPGAGMMRGLEGRAETLAPAHCDVVTTPVLICSDTNKRSGTTNGSSSKVCTTSSEVSTKSALPTGGGSAVHPTATHTAAECRKIKRVSSNGGETARDRERQTETGQSRLREAKRLDLGFGVQIERCALAHIAVNGETFPVGTEVLSYAPPLLWQGTLLCVGSSGDVRGAGMRGRAAVRAVHLDGDDMEVRRCVLCESECVCVSVCGLYVCLYASVPACVLSCVCKHVFPCVVCMHGVRSCWQSKIRFLVCLSGTS